MPSYLHRKSVVGTSDKMLLFLNFVMADLVIRAVLLDLYLILGRLGCQCLR